jgi:quercetin dioxygenase-like cupin family protein
MSLNYTYISNLAKEVEIPKNGILSRTVYGDDQVKAVIFGFDTGQELSSHTASTAALIHVISGEATLTLGGEKQEACAGTWVRMAPNLEHAVYAKSPFVMLLLLLK